MQHGVILIHASFELLLSFSQNLIPRFIYILNYFRFYILNRLFKYFFIFVNLFKMKFRSFKIKEYMLYT